MHFEEFKFALELVGTAAFAVSGALTAIHKKLDILGTIVLGTIAAVGGGLLRDVLLGSLPPSAFIHPVYATVAAAVSLLLFILAYFGHGFDEKFKRFSGAVNLFDAIGLGFFAVGGTNVAIQCGVADNGFLAVSVGVLTGVGGGIIRDLMAAEIPQILRKRVYALAAIVGASAYYVLYRFDLNTAAAMLIGAALTILIRLLATYFKWELPKIKE